MSSETPVAEIDSEVAIEVPNTGRILDYWLGGNHHHSPDRGAAQAFDGIYGDFPGVFGTLRSFIGRACRHVEQQGVDRFLVFGAGIPTRGNVHEAAARSRVLYSDVDRENVRLGQQILAGLRRADYTYCDATDLSSLDAEVVERTLGTEDGSFPLAHVAVGISVFLDDDQLRKFLNDLWQGSARGSALVFDLDSTKLAEFPAALEMLGDGFHMRTPEQFEALLGPWQLSDDGICPVADWRNPEGASEGSVFMYGGVAHKK
jgi:O-methyltransferase involved in polyketide biosynthesis